MHAGVNPFSAQRMHALPFVFADGESCDELSERYWRGVAAGWRRQVLSGPHGSGKSTLLRELGAVWAAQGCQVGWLDGGESHGRVRAWQDLAGAAVRRDSGASGAGELAGRSVLLVDSGERLRTATWLRLWWSWGRCPALVTVHREWGQRVLYRCRPRLEVFLALCDRLLREPGGGERLAWDRESLERVFAEHGGDMRASFFALYERAAGAGS